MEVFLRFPTEEVTYQTPVKEQIICSVDLGINTDAVQPVMRANGTVLGNLSIVPVKKRPDVPYIGTDPQIPEEHGSAQTQEDGHIRNTSE